MAGALGIRGAANVFPSVLLNKEANVHTNTSLRVRRRLASTACIAGVRVSRPNRNARCGRTKL